MGKVLPHLTPAEESFITRQPVFFVATSPLKKSHHVNVSPKSPGSSVVILDSKTIAFADLTGSGSETAAHILENGRITVMFVNLEGGPPQILRLYGVGQVLLPENVEPKIVELFPKTITSSLGFRCIIRIYISRISTSCGYSMPILTFQKYRSTLEEKTNQLGKEGMHKYCTKFNSFSIDGLPSMALLRPDAPALVKPVEEDGFVHGQVLVQGKKNTKYFHSKTSTSIDSLFFPQRIITDIYIYHPRIYTLIIFVAGAMFGAFCLVTMNSNNMVI